MSNTHEKELEMPQAKPIINYSRATPVPEPSRPRLKRTNAIVVPSRFRVEKNHNIPLKKALPVPPKAVSPSGSPKPKKMNPTTPAGLSAMPNSSVVRKPVPDKAEPPFEKIELKAEAPFVYVKRQDTESPEPFPPFEEIELDEVAQSASAHVKRQATQPFVHKLYTPESNSSLSDETTFDEIKLDEVIQPLIPARTINRQDTRPYVHRLYSDDCDLEDGRPIPMEPGRVWYGRNDPEHDCMNRDTDVNQGPSPLLPRCRKQKSFKGLVNKHKGWFFPILGLFLLAIIGIPILATKTRQDPSPADAGTPTMSPRQLVVPTASMPIYTSQPENHPHDTGYELECLANSYQDCWDMHHTYCSSNGTIMNSPSVSLMSGDCTSKHCICTPIVKPRAAMASQAPGIPEGASPVSTGIPIAAAAPTPIASAPPAAGTVSPAIFNANVAEAAAYNKLFATLDFSSMCNIGGIACIDGNVGYCEDTDGFGGAFVMSVCAKGTGCLAVPMNTTRGVFVGCMGTPDAQDSTTSSDLVTSSVVQETTTSSVLTTTTSLVRATTTTITLSASSLPTSSIPTITILPFQTTTQTEAVTPDATPAPTPAPGTNTEPSTPPYPGWVSILTTVSAFSFSGETIPALTFPDFTFPGTYLPATTVPAQTISGWFPPPKDN
jgi:hypothetical protein